MKKVSESAAVAARDIRVVFSRLRRQLKELATAEDLTPSQTSVLVRLFKDGKSSTSELAGAERVRPQSMATTVAALEQRGLIARTPDPEDGRRQVITLTAEGRKRAEDARKVGEEWLAHAMQDNYSESERQIIVESLALLGRLTERN